MWARGQSGVTTFDNARQAAVIEGLLGFLKGRPVDLLPFEQVREGLWLQHVVDRGLQEVPLDAIVGTLGRAREFTRAFLPREESLRSRWEQVRRMVEGPTGLPPVDLYKVGDAYFVVDGHHRVSVARSLGLERLEARVKEYLTPVSLSADESVEDVLLKRFLADFLESTGLGGEGAGEFRLTEVGGYERLLDHIKTHRYFRGLELDREVGWDEAVASWRDTIFRPMVGIIRASDVLADFPGRTEADLYLFVMDHLHFLRERFRPRPVEPEAALRHFRWFGRERGSWLERLVRWWRDLLRADSGRDG
jgi:hypothetical protein